MRISRSRVLPTVIIVAISMALAVIGSLFAPTWLIAASLTVIAGMIGTSLLSTAWVPQPYRSLRRKMAAANSRATDHPILMQYFNDSIARTSHDLDSVIKGGFSFQVSHVPEMSVHAMNLVNKTCILTFPIDQSEALLTPDTGTAGEYHAAMVATAKRMQAEGLPGVVRIFILDPFGDISSTLLKFITKNIEDKIVVRLIFEDELPLRPLGIEGLDFGYYETKSGHSWVMLLRRADTSEVVDLTDYIVDTDPQTVESYRRFSDEIFEKSKTPGEFMDLLAKPINGELWPKYFAERGYEMSPPHGLSDEDADYIIEAALRTTSATTASVLVLGFTPKLIKRLIGESVTSIVSLDQFKTKPSEFKSSVTFRTGNWLETVLDEKFDAIVFDEAINNLSRVQVGLFFPTIRQMLKPGGHVIGRVMGRFDDEVVGRYAGRTTWSAISDLRAVGGTSHDAFASQIICLLHSRNLAFSPETDTVDCGRWNETLTALRDQGAISTEEMRLWRLQFRFALYSPTLDTLLNDAKQVGLSPLEIRGVQGTYTASCKDVSAFYRIVNLEDAPEG